MSNALAVTAGSSQLSTRQQRFLRCIRDEPLTLDEIVKRRKLQPWIISKWLSQRAFRAELAQVLQVERRRRHVLLQIGAGAAAQVLARAAAGLLPKMTRPQLVACRILLEISHKRDRGRRRRRSIDKVLTPSNPVHPEVTDDHAEELLKRLEAKE